MGKQCSKARWQGFQRFIAFIIGGTQVYGQSSKFFAKQAGQDEVAVGDVGNESLLGECKAIDPAAKTQFRKQNPYFPTKTFRIENEWLDQIREEAKSINKLPFLAYNRKFSELNQSHIVLDLDVFIHLIYKAGYGKYETLEEAYKAWKTRNKEDKDDDDTRSEE